MSRKENLIRINVGCGDVPTPGWLNYDNSISVRLASIPIANRIMDLLGLLSEKQKNFISIVRRFGIRHVDVIRNIPHSENTVDVLYSCHMFEHLDRDEAIQFLKEAHRVLKDGGIMRIVVPDLRFHVNKYLKDEDADLFLESLFLSVPKASGLIEKLIFLVVGQRHHLWMYDEKSLSALLEAQGFRQVTVLKSGETMIKDPGNLDLHERAWESLNLEAVK